MSFAEEKKLDACCKQYRKEKYRMKYQRLADKMKELVDISRKVEDDTEYIQEHLSLCTVFECNTLELYKTIQQFAKKT
jgi:hypothetical protein